MRNGMIRRCDVWMCVLVVAGALLCLPTSVHAQQLTDEQLDQEMGEMSFLVLKRKQLDQVADLLDLSLEQSDASLTLFRGYRAQIRSMYAPVIEQQKRQEEIYKKYETRMEEGDEAAWPEYMAEIEEVEELSVNEQDVARTSIEAQDALIEDLQLLLDENQLDRWDRVERWHRRTVMDMGGMFPLTWVAVDLVDIGRTVGVDIEPDSDLDQLVLRYEKELDEPLVKAWDLIRMAMSNKWDDEPDFETQMELMGSAIEIASSMKEINQRYAGSIERAMSASNQSEFRAEVFSRAAPWVYRPSSTQRAMDKALGFGDISDQQVEAINELQAKYAKDIDVANTQWREAIEANEKDLSVETMMMMWSDENESISDAIENKRQIDATFREKLANVLTAEQVTMLPRAFPDQEYEQWFDVSDHEEEAKADEPVAVPAGAGGG